MNKANKQLVQRVNSNKNRNTRFVKIRANRECKSCGKLIPQGTQALTTNKYRQGRQWFCLKCIFNKIQSNKKQPVYINCSTYKNIIGTLSYMHNLAFDDEGGYCACQDAIGEYAEECEKCNRCNFIDSIC